jgi:hypothetical protein
MEIKERVYTLGETEIKHLLRNNEPLECPFAVRKEDEISIYCGEHCPAFQIRKSTASVHRVVELKCFPQEETYPITET